MKLRKEGDVAVSPDGQVAVGQAASLPGARPVGRGSPPVGRGSPDPAQQWTGGLPRAPQAALAPCGVPGRPAVGPFRRGRETRAERDARRAGTGSRDGAPRCPPPRREFFPTPFHAGKNSPAPGEQPPGTAPATRAPGRWEEKTGQVRLSEDRQDHWFPILPISDLSRFLPSKKAGLYFSQAIIWDKQHPVLTRKDTMGSRVERVRFAWVRGKVVGR